jgi:hypothetical protein
MPEAAACLVALRTVIRPQTFLPGMSHLLSLHDVDSSHRDGSVLEHVG